MIRTLIEREPAERWHLTWPRCTIRRYRGAERSTPTEVDARWARRLARSKPGPGRVATGLAVRIDRATWALVVEIWWRNCRDLRPAAASDREDHP